MNKIWEEHPTLYHYTDRAGLEGITSSQTLWARYYKHLNDYTEGERIRPVLVGYVRGVFAKHFRTRRDQDQSFRRFLTNNGGLSACAGNEAKRFVDKLYAVTFGTAATTGAPFAVPYVISFCAHTEQEAYVRKNGLLSMWRGYGSSGGFALVFDTGRLFKCIERAESKYLSTGLYLGDVVYDDASDVVLKEQFFDLFAAMEETIDKMKSGKFTPDSAMNLYMPFFKAATRYKHRGFKEESEVRLVASPMQSETHSAAAQYGDPIPEVRGKAPKTERTRQGKNGSDIRYIVVNESGDQELPITRVIIGPQPEQKKQRSELLRFLPGLDIVCSETPFLP